MPTKLQTFGAVFFDMDGTLIDSEPFWLEAEIELMARFGFVWDEDNQAHCLGGPLDRVGEYMNDLAGRPRSGAYFTQEVISLMAEKLKAGAPFMPGACELIAVIEQWSIPMALVSASPRILMDAVLANMEHTPFGVSISADDVVNVKPHPEGYEKAARFFDKAPRDCLVIEDSDAGVSAAVASGACVLAIPQLVKIQESPRVRTVESLEVVTPDFLKELFTFWNP